MNLGVSKLSAGAIVVIGLFVAVVGQGCGGGGGGSSGSGGTTSDAGSTGSAGHGGGGGTHADAATNDGTAATDTGGTTSDAATTGAGGAAGGGTGGGGGTAGAGGTTGDAGTADGDSSTNWHCAETAGSQCLCDSLIPYPQTTCQTSFTCCYSYSAPGRRFCVCENRSATECATLVAGTSGATRQNSCPAP